jgi:hypothetical protein
MHPACDKENHQPGERLPTNPVASTQPNQLETPMRKIIIASAALTLMCGAAFAQGSTGPANQGDNMNKPGMANPGPTSGSMSGTSGSMNSTTGSSTSRQGMSRDGMNTNTGGESKDGQGMNKGGAMSK